VEEQGAFVVVVVVEVLATGQMETFRRAPAPVRDVLHGVRCVRAAAASVRELLLA